MDFSKAIKSMENGKTIRKPDWTGYLFLDIDENIKYVGKDEQEKKLWNLKSYEDDWEEYMEVDLKKDEVTFSRLESLLDQSSSSIKRLYYLEEIIEGQHKSFKKISDDVVEHINTEKNSLDKNNKFLFSIENRLKIMEENFHKINVKQEEIERFMKKSLGIKPIKKEKIEKSENEEKNVKKGKK
jgi:hypothetical protein